MQNVLLRLREVQPSLSSTERQIAQFILDNPDETTTLTIRELARRSFSSPSSVVRICPCDSPPVCQRNMPTPFLTNATSGLS